ncbi:zinc-binding alcohol dehydrogenase family protein [Methylobacillus caricis]|uniref:zinc-binding alcohol dehydrogenase family protein n=1 Tax=Methylobacillus caricis TaxID=1971611 RepID=UPI001CFF5EA7|nr:zinc-binding alcohol dehydrogenase family protein [Methylobacillus caricis]MCB5187758.1 zinc-binding alcohol dehydrogenase family protein [Methylobacillus caricis]
MKAVALTHYLPIDHPDALLDVDISTPAPGPHDLLVKVEAIAVNPVDTKVRAPKDKVEAEPKVLGWDAVGTVVEIGSAVSLFKVGEAVYYAGDITRQGCNSEYQVVDERIVGHKPKTLSAAEAAALPLTAITAWESLFDRLKVEAPPNVKKPKAILIIGGAGGVGSIAIQLAAKVAGLHVIATASRPESAAWCRELGAHDIVDHSVDIVSQVKALNLEYVDYVLILNNTDQHCPAAVRLVVPQGAICSIVENNHLLDIAPLKNKSASFTWELMFTRAMYKTEDMIKQHYLLNEIARLADHGILRTTLAQTLTPINASNLKKAHAALESGRTIGKIVLEGF